MALHDDGSFPYYGATEQTPAQIAAAQLAEQAYAAEKAAKIAAARAAVLSIDFDTATFSADIETHDRCTTTKWCNWHVNGMSIARSGLTGEEEAILIEMAKAWGRKNVPALKASALASCGSNKYARKMILWELGLGVVQF